VPGGQIAEESPLPYSPSAENQLPRVVEQQAAGNAVSLVVIGRRERGR